LPSNKTPHTQKIAVNAGSYFQVTFLKPFAISNLGVQAIILTASVIKNTQKSVKRPGQKTPQTLILQILRIKKSFQTRTAPFVRINKGEGRKKTLTIEPTLRRRLKMLQENKFESSPNDPVEDSKHPRRDIGFDSLQDFSNWIETQLIFLEAKHRDFATLSSVRGFLKR